MEKNVKILTVAVDDVQDGSILSVDLVDVEGNCIFLKERILYTGDIDFLKENNFNTVSIYPYDLESKKKGLKIKASPQFYELEEVKEVSSLMIMKVIDQKEVLSLV